jgi:hypothetical protein
MVLYYTNAISKNYKEKSTYYADEILYPPHDKHNIQQTNTIDESSSFPETPPISTITETPIGLRANSNNKDSNYYSYDEEIYKTDDSYDYKNFYKHELFHDLVFDKLSTDNKLKYIYKMMVTNQNKSNIHSMICVALLLLILLKLYSN